MVRLDAVRVGGRWVTPVEALERFAADLTPFRGPTPAPAQQSPVARQKTSEAAAAELARRGA